MNKVYLMGDIHGKIQPIRDFVNKESIEKGDTLVLLGDSGLNFFLNERDEKLKAKINSYGINVFVIRGNHDQRASIIAEENPDKWHYEAFWNNRVLVEDKYLRIKYASDAPAEYHIPTANDGVIKTLVLPGAYSVDKYYRLENNWTWFEQEQCNEKERERGVRLAREHGWDLVLSHTCPIAYEPVDLFLSFISQEMIDKTTERWLGGIEYGLDYKLWVWGHFHTNRIYPTAEGHEKVILYNDCYLDVYKYFCGNYPIDKCLTKMYEETQITNLNLIFK